MSNPSFISEDRLEEFRALFLVFDYNRTGWIPKMELISVLKEYNHDISPEEFNELTKEISTLKDRVNFEEFVRLMSTKAKDELIENELIEAFKFIDKKNKGKITVDELKNALIKKADESNVNEQELLEMIKSITSNEDPEIINYKEIVKNVINK